MSRVKWRKIEYFSSLEFDCPDLKGSGKRMDSELIEKLDKARKLARTPFKINSGYRTIERNKKVGGKPNSSHLHGLAADIKCATSRERYLILASCISVGFHRIGVGESFIHVDVDKSKDAEVVWLY